MSAFAEPYIAQILEGTLKFPDGLVAETWEPYYTPWGFTIYRTAFGPSTDDQWKLLLDTITSEVIATISFYKDKEPTAADALISLFRLDPRSDASTQAGATIDQIRELYKNGSGGMPMNAERLRLFLLADDEVLEAASGGKPWIKCVQADYDATKYVPKNNRVWGGGRQTYFGWMKVTARSLLEFWDQLSVWTLERITPPTIDEAQLGVWDGL
ncbi:hypothetical protein Purlil1_12813 [Purpureocillium lilacinum]|uniref:Uncharacterized protein n=1 Tax=Purpureocillium lilacinum TaxID=33203 RepID=A0ABR0BFT3_PURLI|nr:hypothetical protein Purlil1_12813 [Purpureocillium lilacinum]